MRYTDELDRLLACEQDLRQRIGERLAEEAGTRAGEPLTDAWRAEADAAIDAWRHEGDDLHDPRAFRPITPLNRLLADHFDIVERIVDLRDRRLS